VPRVAVTRDGSGGVRDAHLDALRAAGLDPVLVDDAIGACAGVYLPGTDYVPSSPDEDAEAEAAKAGLPWDPVKVRNDLAVLREAKERGLPVLGVCGGMQAMVVLEGGTLRAAGGHQDVEAAEVLLEAGSVAASVFGPRAAANSFHRQVVDRPPRLSVSGRARDGVVEAVEGGRWLGVQWHPERVPDGRPYEWLAAQA
jgi:gamma-glutamyl-gamma-aminobutyrate hydrolase PuuD